MDSIQSVLKLPLFSCAFHKIAIFIGSNTLWRVKMPITEIYDDHFVLGLRVWVEQDSLLKITE